MNRIIYGPDGKTPISSKKPEPEQPPASKGPLQSTDPRFKAMQKTLHLSANQMRGAIRRSGRVARRDGAKAQKSSLDSVRMDQQQASRDEAKRLKVERQKSRGVVK